MSTALFSGQGTHFSFKLNACYCQSGDNGRRRGNNSPGSLPAHWLSSHKKRLPPGPKRTARLQRKESFVADQTDFSHDAEGRRGRRCSCTTTRPTSSMLTRLRDAHSEAGDTSTHAVSQVNIFGSKIGAYGRSLTPRTNGVGKSVWLDLLTFALSFSFLRDLCRLLLLSTPPLPKFLSLPPFMESSVYCDRKPSTTPFFSSSSTCKRARPSDDVIFDATLRSYYGVLAYRKFPLSSL